MKLRRFLPTDASALQRIRHHAIQECAAQFGTPEELELARGVEYYRRQLLQARQSGNQALVGGWVDEDLITMAGIRRKRLTDGLVGLITSMYVMPEYRGRGAGQAMLTHARERLQRNWGLHRVQLNVEVNNQIALDLYLKNGFAILCREENAFRIDGVPHAVYLLEAESS